MIFARIGAGCQSKYLIPENKSAVAGMAYAGITPSRKFVAWLKDKSYAPTAVETPGIHNWPVWRNNLVRFAPLLFGGP